MEEVDRYRLMLRRQPAVAYHGQAAVTSGFGQRRFILRRPVVKPRQQRVQPLPNEAAESFRKPSRVTLPSQSIGLIKRLSLENQVVCKPVRAHINPGWLTSADSCCNAGAGT